MTKQGPGKRPLLEDLIQCLHFSEKFKEFRKFGGSQIETLA
jgi:hypothetical protein